MIGPGIFFHFLALFQSGIDTELRNGGFLVSKETVVLRRWESETKIGFYQTS